ncbi:hypothetical protein B0I35DRAFT_343959, partial [Stachybotrys elegans]
MALQPSPRGFRTRHWRALYESPILSLASLRRSVADGSIFVAIDVEPWRGDSTKAAEIGITLLPTFDDKTSNSLPTTLEDISQAFKTETHWIRLLGRERGSSNQEKHRFGKEHHVDDTQVEQTVSGIIDTFLSERSTLLLQKDCSITPSVVLTGFSMVCELRILSSLYPKVLNRFTSWMDLQQLAEEAMSQDQDNIPIPGLGDTLHACGFGTDSRDSQKAAIKHNAATDSIRTVAVLVRLQQTEPKSLHIKRLPRKNFYTTKPKGLLISKTPGGRTWWSERPKPTELYPYTARIYHDQGLEGFSKQNFEDAFASYNPVALGIHRAKKYGWVCLSSLDALEQFIRDIQGSSSRGTGPWTAVSTHDPAVVPVQSMQELSARRKLEQLSMREEKQKERQLK